MQVKVKEIKTKKALSDHIQRNVDIEHFTCMEKMVLLVISNHVNSTNDWKGWPSLDTLQRLCCATRPTVTKAIKHLTEMGVLTYEKGRTNVSNKYFVDLCALNTYTKDKAKYATSVAKCRGYKHNEATQEDFDNAPF